MGKMMDKINAPCARCLRLTFHKVLHAVEKEEDDGISGTIKGYFRLIECLGCEAVSMAIKTDWDGEVDEQFYPSPISRKKPDWLLDLQMGWIGDQNFAQIGGLFDEVYECVRGGQHRLATMGIRAILENMMIGKVGDQGSFIRNLDAFSEKGYISLVQRDVMSDILDAGHAAMHRDYKPSILDLKVALDITEGIFSAIFVHAEKARGVAQRVPARSPRPPKEKT
jgi:hypothetical protein